MPYFLAEMWKTDLDQLDTEELWEHYEHCLASFDWTYAFSDDIVFGKQAENRIIILVKFGGF